MKLGRDWQGGGLLKLSDAFKLWRGTINLCANNNAKECTLTGTSQPGSPSAMAAGMSHPAYGAAVWSSNNPSFVSKFIASKQTRRPKGYAKDINIYTDVELGDATFGRTHFYCEICKRQIKDLTLELLWRSQQNNGDSTETLATFSGSTNLRRASSFSQPLISCHLPPVCGSKIAKANTRTLQWLLARFNGSSSYVIIKSLKYLQHKKAATHTWILEWRSIWWTSSSRNQPLNAKNHSRHTNKLHNCSQDLNLNRNRSAQLSAHTQTYTHIYRLSAQLQIASTCLHGKNKWQSITKESELKYFTLDLSAFRLLSRGLRGGGGVAASAMLFESHFIHLFIWWR